MIQAEGVEVRLPILEVVQATLQELTRKQYDAFRATIDDLVRADEKLSLLEFLLQRILLDHLDRHFIEQPRQEIRYYSLSAVRSEAADLMSILVHAGHQEAEGTCQAYGQAMATLELSQNAPAMLDRKQCSLSRLRAALDKLRQTIPGVNKRILNAAIVAIAADQEVTVTEAELLRAIGAALNCPIPPLLAGPLRRVE